MEWPKKFFFLCIYTIAGVSSPNCGDKVEVQLLFMAFNILLIYISEELTLEYLNERINSRKWENRRLAH